MDLLLRAVNLSKRFGTLTALEQINLDVYPGEIAGHSRAGKSDPCRGTARVGCDNCYLYKRNFDHA